MKAIIKSVRFVKEFEAKFGGTLYSHEVKYDDKTAYYSSKKKDQTKFVKGQEAEFTEETRNAGKGDFLVIKPIYIQGQSNYARDVKREQSKYSGFADSYVKDLLVAGILKPEVEPADEEFNDIIMVTWKKRAHEIFEHMVELDKSGKS